ncbi:MAG: ADP-ribosylglycohydrolase family protein [Bacilli bacterium]
MLGAIYGDKAGSIYEFDQLNEIKSIRPDVLIQTNSFYSDDTIETIAIIDAIINNKDYEETLREYILRNIEYRPNFSPYFKTSFSPGTIKWAKGEKNNNSIGNGAMMRISPVGYLFEREQEVIENARLVTITSHNSKEAIESATIIALMIYYFKNGLQKDEVYRKLNLLVKYEPFKKFNTTCNETLNNCLYALYYSTSFEDAIRNTLLMGGDTDTNCCIVGSIAETMYGMNDQQRIQAISGLPNEYIKIIKKAYKYIK